jgi:hypothetical protein
MSKNNFERLMHLNNIFILFFCFVCNAAAAESYCNNKQVQTLEVSVASNTLLRADAPPELFGFNIPWYAFQKDLQASGQVKTEVVDWLKPFKGALYRFPGGSPSNYYDWVNSVKPKSERKAMHYEFGNMYKPDFGYDEFFRFVDEVNGNAIITLNIVGKGVEESNTEDVSNFISWVINKSYFHCLNSLNCPIKYLELGNELDWSPYNWSAEKYAAKSKQIIQALNNLVPPSMWVVGGKTTPWASRSNYSLYNSVLSELLPQNVINLAYHPYYDGLTIPSVMKYLDDYHSVWSKHRENASILVTEHARWPSQPKFGNWKDQWYEATSQGGAISSSDFVLALIPNSSVKGAVWHALGTLGPWQLFRYDKLTNTLYPSPVYWGLRVLREGYLKDVVQTQPSIKYGYGYPGGYDLRLVAMKEPGKMSLLGVNRSNHPVSIRVIWQNEKPKNTKATLRYTTAASNTDNNDQEKNLVTMKTEVINSMNSDKSSQACLPENAVFSIVF